MTPSLSIRTTGLLPAAMVAAAVASTSASATPVGETFDFGFRGFANIDGGFVFQDGEPGEEGGQFGPFTFGTPGSLSLFGNPLTLNSSVASTGTNEETWTFSLVADDGGPLYDPQAGFEGVSFFAFRTLGVGAEGFSGGGIETDPIFSPTQDAPLDEFVFNEAAVEIIDSTGFVTTTRNIFSRTTNLGTSLHINYGSASTSEIVISGGGDVTSDTSEIRISYVTAIISDTLVPGDADGDGDVDDTDLGIAISNFTGPGATGKTLAEGDTDGDGDVDDTDLGVAISGFTGPLAAVPEPTSLALLGLGGLLVARRRR